MSNSFNLAIARLTKEHQNLLKNPVPNFLAHPDSKNIFLWHFLIYDLRDSPYEDGFYHGQIIFPTDYPHSPPKLIFKTPNGRFKPDEKICLSFTSFHPESWSVSWNVENMLLGLISFMNTNEHTTGSVQTSHSEKRRLAKNSVEFNKKSEEFNKLFGHFVEKYLRKKQRNIENEKAEERKEVNIGGMIFLGVAIVVLLAIYAYFKTKKWI